MSKNKIAWAETDKDMPRSWRSGSLKYTDFKAMAKGGTATIETCMDGNLQREVAFKKLHPELAHSPVETKRFLREARVTANIAHPGTVPVYELGRDRQGALFFTMKCLQGRDLREIIHDLRQKVPEVEDSFPLPRLVDILIQVCQTVAYAHSCGVIHRDIKPANVLVGEFGEVTVLDWGLAKVRGESRADGEMRAPSANLALTQPGRRYGTPLYMSPEQAIGKDVDGRVDVYNAGLILFEMLTKRGLVRETDMDDVLRQITEETAPRASEIATDSEIPPALDAICAHALEKAPEDRYASMAALILDLQNYRHDQPVSVYRAAPATRWRRWTQAHLVAVVAITSAVLTAGATALLMSLIR
jgi:eukaryotic-like serine/threonine-protein kinase